ncbi:MAG: outer membrane lipoprotein carrier protein LolA [Candidatus Omnitrophica bacterium]|nr:outer membrane lipoprotein carrier protein LolA [Candidatus Omnitrophota bacterium]
MRGISQAVISVGIVLSSASALAFTASYVQTTTGANLPKPDRRTVKIKDDKIRMDMKGAQGEDTVIIINGNTTYSYVPSRNEAYRIENQISRDMSVMSDYSSYLKSLNAEIVGSERYKSYDCDIYEFADPRTHSDSRVWLWKSKNFPVKVEMEMMGNTMTMELEDVQVDIPIADSDFVIPSDVHIIETMGRQAY